MRGSPFFGGIRQIEIEFGGEPARMPVFYYDAGSMTAMFPARYRALQALMPDPRYVPARVAPGIGVVAITCLEYRDTDIHPYNELSIAIALNEPYHRKNLPGRAMIEAQRRDQAHVLVHHLPVTTDIALRCGVDFYNFPKFLGAIEFSRTEGRWRCRLAEGREHILTLSGNWIPAARGRRMSYFCHLWMDGQPQTGQFAQNQLELGISRRRGAAELELGERHPIALELDRLLVSRKPIQYEYAPSFEAVLFGPEHWTLPLIQRGLAATKALEDHPIIA
jgi:Acetoacetate decarboxylase (ADC)